MWPLINPTDLLVDLMIYIDFKKLQYYEETSFLHENSKTTYWNTNKFDIKGSILMMIYIRGMAGDLKETSIFSCSDRGLDILRLNYSHSWGLF